MHCVNWDVADPEEYEYLRGRNGTLTAPGHHVEIVMDHGVDDLADEVAEAIVTTVNTNVHTRPPGYRTPDQVAEEGLDIPPGKRDGSSELYRAVMEVALWYAKLDPRYWGVPHPQTHSYCSECRKGVPIERFSISESRCDMHYEGGWRD